MSVCRVWCLGSLHNQTKWIVWDNSSSQDETKQTKNQCFIGSVLINASFTKIMLSSLIAPESSNGWICLLRTMISTKLQLHLIVELFFKIWIDKALINTFFLLLLLLSRSFLWLTFNIHECSRWVLFLFWSWLHTLREARQAFSRSCWGVILTVIF